MTNTTTSVNETLAFNYTWSCLTSRAVTGNGVPNHSATGGAFATKISSQSISASMPLTPTANTSATYLDIPGYALNSVKFEPGTGGTCPSSATAVSACNYAGGSGTWRMEALSASASPWRFDFGVDSSNAHVQPTGAYHYHGMPENYITKLNAASTSSMTLVGWAMDGYPVYARYGYNTATNAASGVKIMKGSWKTKSTPDSGRPSTSSFAMGHFKQDWEYSAGSGDLDECNGRTGVTPEFPSGIYHYYITDTYPYISRCIMGKTS